MPTDSPLRPTGTSVPTRVAVATLLPSSSRRRLASESRRKADFNVGVLGDGLAGPELRPPRLGVDRSLDDARPIEIGRWPSRIAWVRPNVRARIVTSTVNVSRELSRSDCSSRIREREGIATPTKSVSSLADGVIPEDLTRTPVGDVSKTRSPAKPRLNTVRGMAPRPPRVAPDGPELFPTSAGAELGAAERSRTSPSIADRAHSAVNRSTSTIGNRNPASAWLSAQSCHLNSTRFDLQERRRSRVDQQTPATETAAAARCVRSQRPAPVTMLRNASASSHPPDRCCTTCRLARDPSIVTMPAARAVQGSAWCGLWCEMTLTDGVFGYQPGWERGCSRWLRSGEAHGIRLVSGRLGIRLQPRDPSHPLAVAG